MRARVTAFAVLLALLVPITADAAFVCYVEIVDVWVPGVGWVPVVVGIYCGEYIEVTADPPYIPYYGNGEGGTPIDPLNPPPAPFEYPTVRIVSISDQNPHTPLLTVAYNSVVTRLRVDVGGHSSTITAPDSVFFLPSLNSYSGGATVVVTAYDAYGLEASATGSILRSPSVSTNQNDFLLQYYDISANLLVDRLVHYNRGVATKFVLTDYDMPVVGERNGRVFHEQTEDGLFWSNQDLAYGLNPTPYPTSYVSRYVMHPAYMQGSPVEYFGDSCEPSGLTRQMYPQYQFPSDAGRCDYPAEFAKDGWAGATFDLAEIDGGGTPLPAIVIGGDRVLAVEP